MSLTHKKLMFARAYAKNPNRREAILAAGYSESKWARTASRLLTSREVLAEIERQQNKARKHEQAKPLTFADVINDLAQMREAASDLPGRSGWSQRLKVNQVLGNLLSGQKEQPVPAAESGSQLLSEADLSKRIAELLQELGVKVPEPVHESKHAEMVNALSVTEVVNDQAPRKPLTQVLTDHPLPKPSPAGAPERQQSPNTEPPAGDAKAPPAVNNLVATESDEKIAECPNGHGQYLARRDRHGHFSFCPSCLRDADLDFRKMQNRRIPAGDDRPENLPPGYMLHIRRY